MNIGIELDNIISSPITNNMSMQEVEDAELLSGAKEAVDSMKELGHTITIYTSRDASLGPYTETWLQKHKIHYDSIIFNKPILDIIIDKKNYRFDNWKSFLEKYKYHLRNN